MATTTKVETTKGQKPGRTASKEVRRRQLIDATIESISKHGISGTTMTTVTSIAGLSLGIVNFHFKSKENLFEETLAFLAEEHREQWKKKVRKSELTPQAKLLAVVDAHYHPSIHNRQKLAVWFAFYGEAGYRASYRRLMADIDSERWETVVGLCRTIKQEGAYETVDPITVTKILEALFDGMCLNILIYPKEYSLADAKIQIREYLATTFPKHFDRSSTKE